MRVNTVRFFVLALGIMINLVGISVSVWAWEPSYADFSVLPNNMISYSGPSIKMDLGPMRLASNIPGGETIKKLQAVAVFRNIFDFTYWSQIRGTTLKHSSISLRFLGISCSLQP